MLTVSLLFWNTEEQGAPNYSQIDSPHIWIYNKNKKIQQNAKQQTLIQARVNISFLSFNILRCKLYQNKENYPVPRLNILITLQVWIMFEPY